MRKLISSLGVLLIFSYVVSYSYLYLRAESTFRTMVKNLNDSLERSRQVTESPIFISINLQKFNHGFLKSSAQLKITIHARMLIDDPFQHGKSGIVDMEVHSQVITVKMTYGPYLWQNKQLGMSSLVGSINFPSNTGMQFHNLMDEKNKNTLVILSMIQDFSNRYQLTTTVVPFKVAKDLQYGSYVIFNGATITSRINQQFTSIQTQGIFAGLMAVKGYEKYDLNETNWHSQYSRNEDGYWDGSLDMKLPVFSFKNDRTRKITSTNPGSMAFFTNKKEHLATYGIKIKLGEKPPTKKTFGPFILELTGSNIHLPTLKDFNKKSYLVDAREFSSQKSSRPSIDVLLSKLAKYKPNLTIKKMDFQLSKEISLFMNGFLTLTSIDNQTYTLDGTLTLKVTKSLILSIKTMFDLVGYQKTTQLITYLIEKNILKSVGKNFETIIDIKRSKLYFNGVPLEAIKHRINQKGA